MYKNYVNSDLDDKKRIDNELSKRVMFDDLEAKTFRFDKARGGDLTLGGASNGNGHFYLKDADTNTIIEMTYEGITLSNGAKLMGGDGVLAPFQYPGYNANWYSNGDITTVGGFWFLGYNTDSLSENWANFIEFNVYIPTGFVISEAKISLYHTPVYWDNGGDYALWGYCQSIEAYTVTNYDTIAIEAAYGSEYTYDTAYSFTKIDGAFGTSGFTASIPTTPSHSGETATSNDISSSLSVGYNKIAIKSSVTTPAYNASVKTNGENLGGKTGYVYAVLNVTGYQS